MKIKKYSLASPIGEIACSFDGAFLVELTILPEIKKRKIEKEDDEFAFQNELLAYFSGKLKKFGQKIKILKGTDFQKKVWLALLKIPYGEVRSYKWLAGEIGAPRAARAVGNALNKNPLPLILPCHRIIASDGSIGGFGCGTDVKEKLLSIEKVPAHFLKSSIKESKCRKL